MRLAFARWRRARACSVFRRGVSLLLLPVGPQANDPREHTGHVTHRYPFSEAPRVRRPEFRDPLDVRLGLLRLGWPTLEAVPRNRGAPQAAELATAYHSP